MTALMPNSASARRMDCAAFQLSEVEWDSKSGRFRFIHKNPVQKLADTIMAILGRGR
ncbi:MAG: hypothetical protein ACM3W4_01635 [Ignavibacteriales bacterium]